MSKDTESVLQRQSDLHGRIARSFDNLKKLGDNNITLGTVETRLQLLDANWAKFEAQHDAIRSSHWDAVSSTDYAKQDFYGVVEAAYVLQRGRLSDLARGLRTVAMRDPSLNGSFTQTPRTTLPRIQLPQFSGAYDEWPSFRDLFASIVGKDSNLSDVERLHYLKTSLRGEAEILVRHLATTAENFERAWTILTDHYENRRLLVRSHLSALTALQRMKGESAAELRTIFHGMTRAVTALESIGRPVSNCTDLLVHLMVELLDTRSRREWENAISGTSEPPAYDTLRRFVECRLRTLEALTPVKADKTPATTGSKTGNGNGRSARALHANKKESERGQCSLCEKKHFLLFCPTYNQLSARERREKVTTLKVCENCLGRHALRECKSQKTCGACGKQHHSSLHDAFGAAGSSGASAAVAVNSARGASEEIGNPFLATARVKVADCYGEKYDARALIDPGSEVSFISEALAQRLRLRRESTSVVIVGVGCERTGTARGRMVCRISSRRDDTSLEVSALILPRLTMTRRRMRQPLLWPHVRGLDLADPEFWRDDRVDLLLGAAVYAMIAREGVRKGDPRSPMAQDTSLGWILVGGETPDEELGGVLAHQCAVDEELSGLVRRFWEQEEAPQEERVLTEDEQRCEELFLRTHQRGSDGRYTVRLPVRQPLPSLTATRRAASRLLTAMEARFDRDDRLRDLYGAFMREYESLGHMTRARTIPDDSEAMCYLPHHGVLKEGSTTTKLRVVFNGSQRIASGDSLNQHLLTGPDLLATLPDILLRWRRHRYVMAADVEKMYRQILVHPDDRNLQRILWRDKRSDEVSEYLLNTVTYGLSCAPYLAIRTLRQLAEDEGERWPLAAVALRRDTYVDDVLTGAATMKEAVSTQRQLVHLCKAGGFCLKKWMANAPELMAEIPEEHRVATNPRSWEAPANHSTLGLLWHPEEDQFAYRIPPSGVGSITRRTVLAETARLFDPLGWLSPVLIRAKMMVQTTWLARLDWDVPLPAEEADHWAAIRRELPRLGQLRVARWMGCSTVASSAEIHGFSDASEKAYAGVVYLRTISEMGPRVALVLAKSRVAPLSQVSLPRLELCAAALVARLAAYVHRVLQIAGPIHLWTDSTVALAWIRGHPSKWRTYVANRVADIARVVPEARWHHVPGRDNPADCASRGLAPGDLLIHHLWWRGPDWLVGDVETWPADPTLSATPAQVPELRAAHAAKAEQRLDPAIVRRFSSLMRLLRVSAWCLRWRLGRAERQAANGGDASGLTGAEVDEAHDRWVRAIQSVWCEAEVTALTGDKQLPPSSPLGKLSPTLDAQGVLRVGGRLKHAPLSWDERHPVILPAESHFTTLVIRASHQRTLHGGVQATLALIRQRYWIPRGRSLVKQAIHRCPTCVRWRAATPHPRMSNLPAARVMPARPFVTAGVDYAGPIHLRTTRGRGHKLYKAFICIFVCFSTRATHLEVVSDYTTEAFLAAFRRFTARRGPCRDLHSDCGTNFVGADRQLRAFFRASTEESRQIADHLANERVRWHFNPPAAPHFGGLWEAAVKSAKRHLRRVLGEATLTYEEMTTFLTQVEAVLNSRPLQALSDDPEDLSALTPGHFLIGGPLTAFPEPDLSEEPCGRLSRWQLVQQMRDHLWQRWSQEYLHELQGRTKWWREDAQMRVGDLCLIRGDATPPTRWPLARVVRVHAGEDGRVRVATLRTATSECTRPVVKLVPLPGTESAN